MTGCPWAMDPECLFVILLITSSKGEFSMLAVQSLTHCLANEGYAIVPTVSVTGEVLCRGSFNCVGDDLGEAVDGAGCCLGNPNAMAYTPLGSEECNACVGEFLEYPLSSLQMTKCFIFNSVVGFFNTTFSGVEQGFPHWVSVGYLKGGTIAGQNLVFDIRSTPGTASEFTIYNNC